MSIDNSPPSRSVSAAPPPPRRKSGKVTVVVDRTWGNYADLAKAAPSGAARAFWAKKAEARAATLREAIH